MNQAPQGHPPGLPPDLRFLKHLVTALTATMILGLITIIALFVTRLPDPGAAPALPDHLALPEGSRAEAVTLGRGWIAVVSDRDEILIFDAGSGALRQTIALTPPSPAP